MLINKHCHKLIGFYSTMIISFAVGHVNLLQWLHTTISLISFAAFRWYRVIANWSSNVLIFTASVRAVSRLPTIASCLRFMIPACRLSFLFNSFNSVACLCIVSFALPISCVYDWCSLALSIRSASATRMFLSACSAVIL